MEKLCGDKCVHGKQARIPDGYCYGCSCRPEKNPILEQIKKVWDEDNPKYKCQCEECQAGRPHPMTTGQMIDYLVQHPECIAKSSMHRRVKILDGDLVDAQTEEFFEFWESDLNATWTIVKSEPVKVPFAEAFKAYHRGLKIEAFDGCNFRNYGILNMYLTQATSEQIDNEWIIHEEESQ